MSSLRRPNPTEEDDGEESEEEGCSEDEDDIFASLNTSSNWTRAGGDDSYGFNQYMAEEA